MLMPCQAALQLFTVEHCACLHGSHAANPACLPLQEENAQMREQLGVVQGSRSQLQLTRSDYEVLEATKEAAGEVLEDEGLGEAEQQEEEKEAADSEVMEEEGDKSWDEQVLA
jgi:hypothetical protein